MTLLSTTISLSLDWTIMAQNPLDIYVKEIIRIGTEVQDQLLWRCDAARVDRLEAIRHIILDPPVDYRNAIAFLRQSLEGQDVHYAGVGVYVDLRSIETSLLERLHRADVPAIVLDENRRRIVAEARQIALHNALDAEKADNRLKTATIAKMQRALDNTGMVANARLDPVRHLEVIKDIVTERFAVQVKDLEPLSGSSDYSRLARTFDVYRQGWRDVSVVAPNSETAPGLTNASLLRELGGAVDTVLRLETAVNHLRKQLASYRVADEAAGVALDTKDIRDFDPRSYDDITTNIGDIVPCYKDGEVGCRLEDHTNSEHCADSCHMLKVYRSALTIGIEEGLRRSDALREACLPIVRLADQSDDMESVGAKLDGAMGSLAEVARKVRTAVAEMDGDQK
jgi:hypothetical protein